MFGQPTIRDVNGTALSASAVANPYLFTSRRYDAEAGLYYYRARYYDFATARFLQPDPIGYAPGLNLYAYCNNDAVNFIDPSGEWLETIWDVANIAAGAVSLVGNVRHGNWGWAALDAAGLAVDVVATAIPFLPGGASAALKAARAGNTIADSINVGIDVANVARQTNRAARVVDTSSSAMSYGRTLHNVVGNAMDNNLRNLANFAPIGRANRATGIKPDFPGFGIWADITTPGQWRRHLSRYGDTFGEGISVLYRRGEGVVNMMHLYPCAGASLFAAQHIGKPKK